MDNNKNHSSNINLGITPTLWKDILKNWSIQEIEDLFTNQEIIKDLEEYLSNNIQLKVLRSKIWMDQDQKEENKNKKQIEFYKSEGEKAGHSDKRLNQSQSEFTETCKTLLNKNWIDFDELVEEFKKIDQETRKLRDLCKSGKVKEAEEIQEKANNFGKRFIPIYIILRKNGYTHLDIT